MNKKIRPEESLFLFIDQQEKLVPSIHESARMMKYSKVLADLAQLLDIPGIITTQYKRGLGEIDETLRGYGFEAYDKTTFSAYLNEDFKQGLEDLARDQIVISGAETHICVYQTARDLVSEGYQVYILADAVGSRTEFTYQNGLKLLESLGCKITNTETILFDLLEDSKHEKFKQAQDLIK